MVRPPPLPRPRKGEEGQRRAERLGSANAGEASQVLDKVRSAEEKFGKRPEIRWLASIFPGVSMRSGVGYHGALLRQ